VSRAYYSAYSALADLLETSGVAFAHGRPNPSHLRLPRLVFNNLDRRRFDEKTRRHLSKAIIRLRSARVVSDYVPMQSIDRHVALECLSDAHRIVREAGFLQGEA
jgi:hypothetical protein